MDSFRAKGGFRCGGKDYSIYRLDVLKKHGVEPSRLPYSLRVLLENLLRTEDGKSVFQDDVLALGQWDPKATPSKEIAFTPARVLLQDFTGVPCVVDLAAMREAMAKKAKPLEIECVARGYIAGSLYKQYRTEGGNILGFEMPAGLIDSDRLPEPIFSPATKAKEGHDENISFARACDIVGRETAELVRDWTLELYRRAAEHAASAGLILADTKFEFGETEDGIIWIDEALTPDSSRFWDASLYNPGRSQASYDKQFVRDYLETLDWDKRPPGPVLPAEIVAKTRAKYVEAFERITGRAFSAE